MLRPGAETGRPLRRAGSVRRLGRAHAHRLRRLPGVLARPEGRRRRRHVQEHLRRLVAPLHAGDRRRRAAAARCRHPDGARRLPAAAEPAGRDPARGRAHRRLGGTGQGGHTRDPTRRCSASCRAASSDTMRRESAQRTVEIGFDGYGIGGLSVGETRARDAPGARRRARAPPDGPPALPDGRRRPGVARRGRGARRRPVRLRDADPPRPPRHGPHRRRDASRSRPPATPNSTSRSTATAPARCAPATAAATSATCSRSASRPQRACCRIHNVAWTLDLMDRMRVAIAAGTFDQLRRSVLDVWG